MTYDTNSKIYKMNYGGIYEIQIMTSDSNSVIKIMTCDGNSKIQIMTYDNNSNR